ncbi:cobyrinic acid a,c-diamide synthase [Thermoanaerobacter ethanolicus JW 200]|nr:cobyrinic acid a,c-diamide synthase [Thermoanaerobacter ethanolicus JW 200]
MYDGIDTTKKGSSADIAKILDIPVILVVDASSMATSVSALIMGYMHYDREVKLKG